MSSDLFANHFIPLVWADFRIKLKKSTLNRAFWSVEPIDFKNVIVENIFEIARHGFWNFIVNKNEKILNENS